MSNSQTKSQELETRKIYLAIAYSGLEEVSFKVANKMTALIMNDTSLGYQNIVYSPISHNHVIAIEHSLPTTWDFWKTYDTKFIEWCDELWITEIFVELYEEELFLCGKSGIDGWKLSEQSKGVTAEIQIAKELGKIIKIVPERPTAAKGTIVSFPFKD